MPSDIHVFVKFKDQCVFAGEDLNCTITFRNVAELPEVAAPRPGVRRSSRQGSISKIAAQSLRAAGVVRGLQTSRPGNGSVYSTDTAARASAGLSLNIPPDPANKPLSPSVNTTSQTQRPVHKQQRSVSIISATFPAISSASADAKSAHPSQRPNRTHRRSSTVQVYSGTQLRPGLNSGDAPAGQHIPVHNDRRSPLSSTSGSTPLAGSRQPTPDFKFPDAVPTEGVELDVRKLPARPGAKPSPLSHASRVISSASNVPSERSSGEFYSISNNSQETLISEQQSILSDPPQPMMTRQHNRTGSRTVRKPQAVNLLMGYAQVNATFTLDGSLVDQSQFEEVKKKGFLGGQGGGGVVGVKKARPASGFLGNFNFNSIGESLNTLVGGDNMSSVREMNAVTNSRAIPLLSTPQSLLFVDLHLEPGEERSYSFSYSLPRGLPSSYRGKAIKTSYNILVGVQGVPGGRDVHSVRQISVPLRVFSGVDSDGEIFGHDLFQPHVVLRDMARTKLIVPTDLDESVPAVSAKPSGSTAEFLQFVDKMIDRHRRRQSSSGVMDAMFSGVDMAESRPAVQAINRAILLSNQMYSESDSSPNRFEISRGGLRVAVVILDRALHRLGETLTAVIDFTDCQVPCAALHSTLETTEKVTQSLAIRSAAAISRITRKVYGSRSENVLFSKRAVFTPSIPAGATPTFVTSGINLEWSLRLEFGTIKAVEAEDGEMKNKTELFEEVVKDERGTVNIAVERLDCETFEVVIPITVYGDVVLDGREEESEVGFPL